MAYGPGENAYIIDRPTSEGGDSVERFAQKTEAQFDALYTKLNAEIAPASQNSRGLVRLATQNEVNGGAADDAVVTPKTLANSSLATSITNSATSAAALTSTASSLTTQANTAESTAAEALEKAEQAVAKAEEAADEATAGMEYPTDATFKAMPEVEAYDSSGGIDNRRKLKLPSGGKWIYCGRLIYHWENPNVSVDSSEREGDEDVALCGIGTGGSVIWHSTMDNHGQYLAYSMVYGFCWKFASAS